jgi:DNA-binding CsgD family transcriptional regulator
MDTNFNHSAPFEEDGGVSSSAEPMPRIYLTSLEIAVVGLVVRGHSNAEIAAQLGIQLQAVKNLLSALYAKLGVSTRLQLALLALRTGFDPS